MGGGGPLAGVLQHCCATLNPPPAHAGPRCPPGWSLFPDAHGTEDGPACLVVLAEVHSVTSAVTACGAHAGASSSRPLSFTSSALADFAASLLPSSPDTPAALRAAWLPVKHDGGASRTVGWAWADGTPASFLNCNTTGCGSWHAGHPRCVRARVNARTAGTTTTPCRAVLRCATAGCPMPTSPSGRWVPPRVCAWKQSPASLCVCLCDCPRQRVQR
jgi:hypothetical protein